MRRGARVALAAVLAASAAGAAAAESGATTPCRLPGWPHELRCGSVARPLDPARPEGPRIDVHYAVVPAAARRRKADPVFLLAGGPGQSAIAIAPATLGLFTRLMPRRDIVFVDQRGTGRSAPLACELPPEPLSRQGDVQRQVDSLLACKARLAATPPLQRESDLGFFTTAIASQDLDAVRAALGAERINLVGASYGTRAALDYLRQFPQRVRRAALDGAAPPDMDLPASAAPDANAALEAAFAGCAAEPACAARHPRLREQWAALLASLPREATLPDPRSGAPERLVLTREMLHAAVRQSLYLPSIAAALPEAIALAAQGRFEALAGLGAWSSGRREQQPAVGMHFSVVCAEDRVPEQGEGPAEVYRRVCAQWPRGAVPPEFRRMPASPAPVLVMSGGLDPVTPPRHGERVVAALGANARHLVVPAAGHGTLALPCVRETMQRFIDADDDAAALALPLDCARHVPRPPAFALPEAPR